MQGNVPGSPRHVPAETLPEAALSIIGGAAVLRLRYLRPAAVLAALALTLAGGMVQVGQAQTGDEPRVRVIHAVYGVGALDVTLGDVTLAGGLEYGAATEYQAVGLGELELAVREAGAGEPLVTESVELEAGADYSLVLLGEVGLLEPVMHTDDTTPPEAGRAKISLINANLDALDLDLFLGDELIVEGLPYSDASDYVDVAAGAYDLSIRDFDTGTDFVVLPGAELAERTTYSVVAMGAPDDPTGLLLIDTPRTPPVDPSPTPTQGSGTPAATNTPAPTAAASGTPSSTAATTPTAGATTTATGTVSATATSTATATATPLPNLPDTGFGSSDGGTGGGLLSLPVIIVALLGLGALGLARWLRQRPG